MFATLKTSGIVVLLLLAGFFTSAQQVKVNVSVLPPYQLNITDYQSRPNQLIITLTNLSNTELQVQLLGTFTGDNGVSVSTVPGFRGGQPIILAPLQVRTVRADEVPQLFDVNKLDLKGISKAQFIRGAALPEGNYQLCVRAYDYRTQQPLSADQPIGCSNIFPVNSLEAPTIIKPFNDESVVLHGIQNILFTWTTPPNAPPSVSYKIRIIELLSNNQSPAAAFLNKLQINSFEQTVYGNALLYGPSYPQLAPGKRYAVMVTAIDAGGRSIFRNNGNSEVITFKVAGPPAPPAVIYASGLQVLAPNKSANTETVSEDNPLAVSWGWQDPAHVSKDTMFLVDTAWRAMGVRQYRVKIVPATAANNKKTDAAFSFGKVIGVTGDSTLHAYLQQTAVQCDSIGMRDQYWYKATVWAEDAVGGQVAQASSVEFQYLRVKDTAGYHVSVNGLLQYKFDSLPGIYPIPNADVQIQVKRRGGNTNFFYLVDNYSGTTDSKGVLSMSMNVPLQQQLTDTLYYIMRINSPYYQQLPVSAFRALPKDTVFNLGYQVTNVYGYSLKVIVTEGFTANTAGAVVPGVDTMKLARAGTSVTLFRKSKKSYQPPIEGELQVGGASSGDVQIADGTTQLEKGPDGKDRAFVKFDRLVCNQGQGDVYYILAKNPVIGFGVNNGAGSASTAGFGDAGNSIGSASKIGKATTESASEVSYGGTKAGSFVNYSQGIGAFEDTGFIATVMPFVLPKAGNTENVYQAATVNYDIMSKKPPTSTIKGQIVFRWPSDPTKELRPVRKTKVSVKIYYTDQFGNHYDHGGSSSSSGSTGTSTSTNGPAHNGSSHGPLPKAGQDGYGGTGQGSGTGETSGHLGGSHTSGSGTSTEGWDPNSQNFQPSVEDGKIVGVGETDEEGRFSIDMVTATNQVVLPLDNFRRYRLVLDNPYVGYVDPQIVDFYGVNGYVSMDIFNIDSFSTKDLGQVVYNAQEGRVRMKVHSSVNHSLALGGVKVIAFRNPANKPAKILPGEGDATDTTGLLVDPYDPKNNDPQVAFNANSSGASGADASTLFNKPFEKLWSLTTPASGEVIMERFFSAELYNNHVNFEISGDPTQGQNLYGAYITNTYGVSLTSVGTTNEMEQVLDVYLDPLPSRISGRIMDKTNTAHALSGYTAGGQATIQFIDAANHVLKTKVVWSDDNGYFIYNWGDGGGTMPDGIAKVTVTAAANGYYADIASQNIGKTGQQFVYTYLLKPKGSIKGKVVDENGQPVKAYIRRLPDSLVSAPQAGVTDGSFTMFLPDDGVSHTIQVIPMDPGYFDSTMVISSTNIDGNKNLGAIAVYRRKHRMRFVVSDGSGNRINNARIVLDDEHALRTGYSIPIGQYGMADTSFENVSVNNYTYYIYGPSNSGFVPRELSIKNEESKEFMTIPIKLESGSTVTGKVTLDGHAVANAKVYMDLSGQVGRAPQHTGNFHGLSGMSDDESAGLVVSYTDASGVYALKGIPVNNTNIEVIATLDTSFTTVGDQKTVTISNGTGKKDLGITSYKGMVLNSVFGFPLTVESLQGTATAGEVIVTGLVDLSAAHSDFVLLQGSEKLRIRNMHFKANALKVGLPVSNTIPLEGINSLKFQYINKYNVELVQPGANGVGTMSEIALSMDNTSKGQVLGKVRIVDNSFNYPSTYLSFTDQGKQNFYLATLSGQNVNTAISSITAATDAITAAGVKTYSSVYVYQNYLSGGQAVYNGNAPKYYLSNGEGKAIAMKFIEFDATADPLHSFIAMNGKIHLDIDMKCNIPNAKPANFTVEVKDVVLDNNSITPASSQSPLELQLEKWKLVVKDWKLDPEKGGIYSENGFIQTSKLNIPFNFFNLRHDMFKIDGWNVANIKLGNIIPLASITKQNAMLVYDPKVGSDASPHWKFTVVGNNGQPAAQIPSLKGFPANSPFDVAYIQLLSNEENIFTIQQTNKTYSLMENKYALFSPQGIMNGPDYFQVYGSLNIPAPRFVPSIISLTYKDAVSIPTITDTAAFNFEGKGYVQFSSLPTTPGQNTFTIDKTAIRIPGMVQEVPKTSFKPMKAVFIASDTVAGHFEVLLDQPTEPISDKYTLNLVKGGGMKVKNNDWDLLVFTGQLVDTKETGKGNALGANNMTFTVNGDVQVTGSQIKTTTNLGFGDFVMIFDYTKPSMYGSLDFGPIGFDGGATLAGNVETMFDKNGWFLAGAAKASIPSIPLLGSGWDVGFFIGNYDVSTVAGLKQKISQFADPQVKDCWLDAATAVKGYYFTAGKSILDFNESFDLIVVSGYVYAKGGIELSNWANFAASSPDIGLQVGIYARVGAGGSAPGFSINGEISADAVLKTQLANGKFNLSGTVDMSAGFNACVCLPLTSACACANPHLTAGLYISTDGTHLFKIGTGGDNRISCSMQQ